MVLDEEVLVVPEGVVGIEADGGDAMGHARPMLADVGRKASAA